MQQQKGIFALLTKAAKTVFTRPIALSKSSRLRRCSDHFCTRRKPHKNFHARYGDERVSIRIDDGEILDGNLGRRALRLVDEWRMLHLVELQEEWRRAQLKAPLGKIEPLG